MIWVMNSPNLRLNAQDTFPINPQSRKIHYLQSFHVPEANQDTLYQMVRDCYMEIFYNGDESKIEHYIEEYSNEEFKEDSSKYIMYQRIGFGITEDTIGIVCDFKSAVIDEYVTLSITDFKYYHKSELYDDYQRKKFDAVRKRRFKSYLKDPVNRTRALFIHDVLVGYLDHLDKCLTD